MGETRIVISLSDATAGEDLFSKIEQILEEHPSGHVNYAFLETKPEDDSFAWKVLNKWEPDLDTPIIPTV